MKKKILVFTLLMALFAFNATAYAKTIAFEINKSDGAILVTTNTKDLSGSEWKISNSNTTYSNFIENSDVIGFRTRNTSGTALSAYHTFSKFVYRYSLPYTTTPATGQTLRLHSQVDSTGQYNNIKFEGEWVS